MHRAKSFDGVRPIPFFDRKKRCYYNQVADEDGYNNQVVIITFAAEMKWRPRQREVWGTRDILCAGY